MVDTVTTGTRRDDDKLTHLERINGPRAVTADDWVQCGPAPEVERGEFVHVIHPEPVIVGEIEDAPVEPATGFAAYVETEQEVEAAHEDAPHDEPA
jgi:hypothetical protein